MIWGDAGDDVLYGGLGDDTLTGDNCSGGQGVNTFVLAAGTGIDLIGLVSDLIFGELTLSANEILIGEEVLATLKGVDATTLIEINFTTV